MIIKFLLVVVNNLLNLYEFAFDYDTAFLLVLLPMVQKVTRKVTPPLVTPLFYLLKEILVTLFLNKKISKPLFLPNTQLVFNTKSCFKTCLRHQKIGLNVVLDGTLLALQAQHVLYVGKANGLLVVKTEYGIDCFAQGEDVLNVKSPCAASCLWQEGYKCYVLSRL